MIKAYNEFYENSTVGVKQGMHIAMLVIEVLVLASLSIVLPYLWMPVLVVLFYHIGSALSLNGLVQKMWDEL